MPYIKSEDRQKFDKVVDEIVELVRASGTSDGDLNYIITRLLAASYAMDTAPRYTKINSIVGILECVKLEFYQRVAVKYERNKSVENGDVAEYERFNKDNSD